MNERRIKELAEEWVKTHFQEIREIVLLASTPGYIAKHFPLADLIRTVAAEARKEGIEEVIKELEAKRWTGAVRDIQQLLEGGKG